MKKFIIPFILILLVVSNCSLAESIFANRGLGLFNYGGGIRSAGMAGTGIAMGDSLYFHGLNPATWYNAGHARYTIAAILRRGHAKDDFASDDSEEFIIPGMAISAPIYKTFAVGVQYDALTDYNFYLSKNVTWEADPEQGRPEDERYLERFQGEGGLSRIGINLAARYKVLSFGLASDVYFGQFDNIQIIDFDNDAFYKSGRSERRQVYGYGVRAGFQADLTDTWSVAATANLPVNLKVDTSIQYEGGDSVSVDDPDFELPFAFNVGVSKLFGRWKSGFDFGMEMWEDVTPGWDDPEAYTNTIQSSIGVERVPLRGPLDPWYEKWMYRAGLRYSDHYLKINDEKLTTIGAAIGAGIPVKTVNGMFDIAFTFDYRGDQDKIGAREMIWGFQFGWTAAEKWFVRRKR